MSIDFHRFFLVLPGCAEWAAPGVPENGLKEKRPYGSVWWEMGWFNPVEDRNFRPMRCPLDVARHKSDSQDLTGLVAGQ